MLWDFWWPEITIWYEKVERETCRFHKSLCKHCCISHLSSWVSSAGQRHYCCIMELSRTLLEVEIEEKNQKMNNFEVDRNKRGPHISLRISRALNYTTYALIQHICSFHVAYFQQICRDYAVNFWEKEKLCTKTDNQVAWLYWKILFHFKLQKSCEK